MTAGDTDGTDGVVRITGEQVVPVAAAEEPADSLAGRQVALIDLLDRLLNGGAVLTGDLVLSIADIDLVHINLRAVIRSITSDEPAPW
ncbi:gas vesicle protein [Streptomyces nitrosporeus]|uniref:gas vesicle protein n=1 Tax=Streptomyces nitrosporeus TaxID=28894 RepID=UPI0039A1A4F1